MMICLTNLEEEFLPLSGFLLLHNFVMVTTFPCSGTRRFWAVLSYLFGGQVVMRQHWGHRRMGLVLDAGSMAGVQSLPAALWEGSSPALAGFQWVNRKWQWLGAMVEPRPGTRPDLGHGRRQEQHFSSLWKETHTSQSCCPFSTRQAGAGRQTQHLNQPWLIEAISWWRQGFAKPQGGIYSSRKHFLTNC